jgi:predicted nuclease of predicted toxin-antitoxin system
MTEASPLIWLDAQLSPTIAHWLSADHGVLARPIRDLGLRDADDPTIFAAARMAEAVVMTKDGDFVQLLERFGPPPSVIWVTCGNTSNDRLRALLNIAWPRVMELLRADEPLIEISEPAT